MRLKASGRHRGGLRALAEVMAGAAPRRLASCGRDHDVPHMLGSHVAVDLLVFGGKPRLAREQRAAQPPGTHRRK